MKMATFGVFLNELLIVAAARPGRNGRREGTEGRICINGQILCRLGITETVCETVLINRTAVVRDPYARWCGRGEAVRPLPIPIRGKNKNANKIGIGFHFNIDIIWMRQVQ
jgi:hypothetical protein